MYNLNELAFEAMLEKAKQENKGNLFIKRIIDSISYEYNRKQYNDCLRHINEENNKIASIYNQISQRGGFITLQEYDELQKHIQNRNEYEIKSMKHFTSGINDSQDLQSNITNITAK